MTNNQAYLQEISRASKYEANSFDDYLLQFIVDSCMADQSLLLKLKPLFEKGFIFIYYSFYLFNSNPTPGQNLFNVTYHYESFSKLKRLLFILIKLNLPGTYFDFIENQGQIEGEEVQVPSHLLVALLHKVFKTLNSFYIKYKDHIGLALYVLKLANFLSFIYNGEYPSLASRILGLKYAKINPNSLGSGLVYNFLLKKLVVSKLYDISVFIFKNFVGKTRIESFFTSLLENSSNSKRSSNNTCLLCSRICTGLIKLDCNHIFCYFCIESYRSSFNGCPKCLLPINKPSS